MKIFVYPCFQDILFLWKYSTFIRTLRVVVAIVPGIFHMREEFQINVQKKKSYDVSATISQFLFNFKIFPESSH